MNAASECWVAIEAREAVASVPTDRTPRDRASGTALMSIAVAMFALVVFLLDQLGLPAEVLWILLVGLAAARPLLWAHGLDMELTPPATPRCQAPCPARAVPRRRAWRWGVVSPWPMTVQPCRA